MGLFIPRSVIRKEGHTDRDLVGSAAGRGWRHSQQDGGTLASIWAFLLPTELVSSAGSSPVLGSAAEQTLESLC